MGADRGILVQHEGELDSFNVAQALKAVIAEETPDCVIMGKQAIDDDSNQASQILAEMLGWGQATQANTVTIEGDDMTVIREADGGLETVAMKLPAIVSTDLRLNEPRYPNLPGIMKAKRKPLAEKTLGDLGVEVMPRVVVKTLEAPSEKEAGQLVPDVTTLIEKLQNEAKAL
jgi:electron transfer flavoprotein beta subunit